MSGTQLQKAIAAAATAESEGAGDGKEPLEFWEGARQAPGEAVAGRDVDKTHSKIGVPVTFDHPRSSLVYCPLRSSVHGRGHG